MQSDYVGGAVLIVGVAAGAWWVVAPALASLGDGRLKARNPDHHAKIVRFYRAWGLIAIVFGVTIGVVVR